MRKALDWLRRHPFLVLVLLMAGAGAAVWCFAESPRRIDVEHFNQIELGMTTDDVERIVGGSPGRFGMAGGWLGDTWLRWKGRNGSLSFKSFNRGNTGYQIGGGAVHSWYMMNLERFAMIDIFLDDHGKVRGVRLLECEF